MAEKDENKMIQKSIDRVSAMEKKYYEAGKSTKALEVALAKFRNQKSNLEDLFEWYFSRDWMNDYDLDEKGYFPKDMKRGVLCQDALYDLYQEMLSLEEELNKTAKMIEIDLQKGKQ